MSVWLVGWRLHSLTIQSSILSISQKLEKEKNVDAAALALTFYQPSVSVASRLTMCTINYSAQSNKKYRRSFRKFLRRRVECYTRQHGGRTSISTSNIVIIIGAVTHLWAAAQPFTLNNLIILRYNYCHRLANEYGFQSHLDSSMHRILFHLQCSIANSLRHLLAATVAHNKIKFYLNEQRC